MVRGLSSRLTVPRRCFLACLRTYRSAIVLWVTSATVPLSKTAREIVREMQARHDARAVILYGSQAAGVATEGSDWDILVLSPRVGAGEHKRDARAFAGTYLDAFVESEALGGPSQPIREEHLRLLGAQILHDTEGLARRLIAAVEALYQKGPPLLSSTERTALSEWLWRTHARAQGGTTVSDLRRVQLLSELLPSYFKLRGAWFLGARTSLAVLEKKDPHAFALFQRALLPDAAPDDIHALVGLVAMAPASAPAVPPKVLS